MRTSRLALFVIVLAAAGGCKPPAGNWVGTYSFVETQEYNAFRHRGNATGVKTRMPSIWPASGGDTLTLNADGTYFSRHLTAGSQPDDFRGKYSVEGDTVYFQGMSYPRFPWIMEYVEHRTLSHAKAPEDPYPVVWRKQ